MRVRGLQALLIGGSLVGLGFAQDAEAPLTRYTITAQEEGVAHVRIEITLAGRQLDTIHKRAAGGMTNDDMLSNVTVTGDFGTAQMGYLGTGTWSTAPAKVGQRVTVDYDLALDHGDHTWDHGREEVGFRLGDGAYLVGRTTILADYTSSVRSRAIEVEFKAADSAAPWTQLGENLWRAEDLSAFHNNGFAFGDGFGRFIAETEQGNVTFIHDALSKDLAQQAARDIAPSLAHTTAIFGGFPASNFHIFLFENNHPEGGAFDDSFAMLHPAPAQAVDASIWRQGFIHEINHIWVGHAIRQASGSDIEWFKEGVADYLAIKTMWQLGYLDDRGLAAKLENLMRRHTLGVYIFRGKIAMTEAGANKSQNQMIVYGSGATWAFMLDVEMAEDMYPGAFEDMLRDLYEHCAVPYTFERLMERMNEFSNAAAGRLVAKFDRNLMPMAFPNMLEPYGMEIAFMIPDMFELDLSPHGGTGAQRLPAFLRPRK